MTNAARVPNSQTFAHTLMRTSESKGHEQLYNSSLVPLLNPEFAI